MIARRLLVAAAGGGAFADWTRGTLSAGGSPVTILADGGSNLFPGAVRLDANRILVVWNRWSGGVGDVYGLILTTANDWASFTPGSEFLIYHGSDDILLDDAASIVDGKVVIAFRYYDGSVNYDSHLLTADLAGFTSSSTWSVVDVPLTDFTSENLITGRVHKLGNGTYLVGYYGNDTSANFEAGVLISGNLTDWSARTLVNIAPVHANNYTEIDIEQMPDDSLIAHIRTDSTSPLQHFRATSSDYGATWTSPVTAFTAHGFPAFRRLTSGLQLTVYRRATSAFATYWRQSDDDGASWSGETLLDGTLIGGHTSTSAYATFVQIDSFRVLCIYSITDDRFIGFAANLYSQVFTDSSTH